ncbi:MAG: alpha/beta fold hydrolase [Candidatus Tectomicrobia bacterium]|nr:alpha/beta fold hydrolase [Candidatus Tectomicrobia bacterium]
MSTYVLIHGAWHGGWCWEKVAPLLQRDGHTVVAPDLPGHGQDPTPTAEVTLERYARRVCEVLAAQPEPAILVGHSMGGIIITQAAEDCPRRIRRLVYLTAFLLRNGESRLTLTPPDTVSLVRPNMVLAADGKSATIRPEAVREVFYADCPEEDARRAAARLVPQALQPLGAAVRTSEANFGRIPRAYIECLNDRAIAPHLQKVMYTRLACAPVISMNTSHSPFYAAPEELAAHLSTL